MVEEINGKGVNQNLKEVRGGKSKGGEQRKMNNRGHGGTKKNRARKAAGREFC